MKIGDWIRNRSNKEVQLALVIIVSTLILSRLINSSVRGAIDVVTIVMFCVLLLAVLREDIKELISNMKGVGFPGTQIPITSLNNEVNDVEKKYRLMLKENLETDSSTLQGLDKKFLIDEKIEFILNLIVNEYQKLSSDKTILSTEGTELATYLLSVDVIGKDIYQVAKSYIKVESSESKESLIIRTGRKIVRLLNAIWLKFKNLRILTNATDVDFVPPKSTSVSLSGMTYSIDDKNNSIQLFTSLNLVDELDHGYPILGVTKDDVQIKEIINGEKIEAKVVSVSKVDDSVNIYVCILIDCSTSMNNNGKMNYAKEAAIKLIKSFFQSGTKLKIHCAIYPVTSINDKGFYFFEENRQWSSSVSELVVAINSLVANGDTPLLDAISATLRYIDDQKGYKYIICVSDGADNISSVNYENIYNQVRDRETPIYSIGYGEEEYLNGLVNISKLSKAGPEGSGSFMRVHPNQLIDIFSYLGSMVNNAYQISWIPLEYSKGQQREIELTIFVQDQTGTRIMISFNDLSYRMK